MASYKSTTSYLRYLQPQHQTATKYDTMVAAVKNNAKVKTYNFKRSWSNKAQFDAKSFVRRSKDGHRAKASYYNDERPSLENSRLKPQSSDLQKFKHQQQRRRKLKLQNKVSNKRPCSKEKKLLHMPKLAPRCCGRVENLAKTSALLKNSAHPLSETTRQ